MILGQYPFVGTTLNSTYEKVKVPLILYLLTLFELVGLVRSKRVGKSLKKMPLEFLQAHSSLLESFSTSVITFWEFFGVIDRFWGLTSH